MSYGGYKSWRPGSRRNRRRQRGSRREATQGADRTFLIIAGLFSLAVILVILGVAFFGG